MDCGIIRHFSTLLRVSSTPPLMRGRRRTPAQPTNSSDARGWRFLPFIEKRLRAGVNWAGVGGIDRTKPIFGGEARYNVRWLDGASSGFCETKPISGSSVEKKEVRQRHGGLAGRFSGNTCSPVCATRATLEICFGWITEEEEFGLCPTCPHNPMVAGECTEIRYGDQKCRRDLTDPVCAILEWWERGRQSSRHRSQKPSTKQSCWDGPGRVQS